MSEEEKVKDWLFWLDKTEEHLKTHLGDVRFMISTQKEPRYLQWYDEFPKSEDSATELVAFPHGTCFHHTAVSKNTFSFAGVGENPLPHWEEFFNDMSRLHTFVHALPNLRGGSPDWEYVFNLTEFTLLEPKPITALSCYGVQVEYFKSILCESSRVTSALSLVQ